MKSVKRMRHYCDYCKKVMSQRPAMERHEKSCTANPDRTCRVCDKVGVNQEAVSYVESLSLSWDEFYNKKKQGIYIDKLREITESCHACMLAAVRCAKKCEIDFDYKEEQDRCWKERSTQYDGY